MIQFLKLRTILQAMVIFSLLNIFFVLLLISVQLIDNDKIHENVLKSFNDGTILSNMEKNSYFPRETYTFCVSAVTNIHNEPRNILERALLGKGYAGSCHYIKKLLNEPVKKYSKYLNYARYWHGYQIYLRPLLRFFSVKDIHILMFFVLIFSILTYAVFLSEISSKWLPIMLLAPTFLFTGIFSLHATHAFIFIITLLSSCYLIKIARKGLLFNQNKIFGCFFFGSVILNFFDFILTPQIMPMLLSYSLVLCCYFNKELDFIPKKVASITFMGIMIWFAGYGMTFMAKGILNVIVLPFDQVFLEIVVPSKLHLGHDSDFLYPTKRNIEYAFSNNNFQYIVYVVAIFSFGSLIHTLYNSSKKIVLLRKLMILSIPSLAGILWYEILRGHSIIHMNIHSYHAAYFILVIPIINGFIISFTGLKRRLKNIWI